MGPLDPLSGIQIAKKFNANMDWLYVGRQKTPDPTIRIMGLTDEQIRVPDLIVGLFENGTLNAEELNRPIVESLRARLPNKA